MPESLKIFNSKDKEKHSQTETTICLQWFTLDYSDYITLQWFTLDYCVKNKKTEFISTHYL